MAKRSVRGSNGANSSTAKRNGATRRGRVADHDDLRRLIGHEIRRARLGCGLRLADVGRWIDRGTSSMHEYESGSAGLEAADLIVLAARLGIDMAGVTRMIAQAMRVEDRRAVARCGAVR